MHLVGMPMSILAPAGNLFTVNAGPVGRVRHVVSACLVHEGSSRSAVLVALPDPRARRDALDQRCDDAASQRL
jgi:hypothetical protein